MAAKGRNDIEMRITADSRGVASGLAPMMKGLQGAQKSAADTETALNEIGAKPIKLSVNDQAVENARVEVARLRAAMAQKLALDPTANTKDAEKRIKDLQRSIKVLDAEDATVDVAVRTTGLQTLTTVVSEVRNGFVGSGGLIQGLGAARAGIAGVGGEAAAAAVPLGIIWVTMGVAAKQAWDLGEAAADVQTSVSQLDALTGGLGAKTFEDLNKFAAQTPFELAEVTDATKRLVAAGIQLSDIPDYLHDVGNVAAATGVPISQLATVFAQMESSGRASYEDLKQLAEAGIPVWQTLSDKLGIATVDLQKMASEGQLSADTIDLLRESLNELYPTAMQQQSETFNGQMSTLKDTFHTMGADLGSLFLPAMQSLVGWMQDLADVASGAVNKLVDINDKVRLVAGAAGSMGEDLPVIGGLIDSLTTSTEEAAAAEEEQKKKSDALAASILEQAAAAKQAADDISNHTSHLEALAQAVDDAAGRYADLVESFTSFNDGLIEGRSHVFDYQGAVDSLAESLVKSGNFSPDKEEGRANWDALVGFAEAASDRVQDAFETKGAGAATALQRSFRRSLAQMLIDAGKTAPEAWKLVNQVLEEPHQVNIELGEIDTSKLNKRLAELRQQRADITGQFVLPVDATEKEIQRVIDERGAALKPIQAKIDATVEKIEGPKGAKAKLDEAAKDRNAKIIPHVPPKDVEESNATLDGIVKLRKARIKIEIIPPAIPFFGGLPVSGPAAAPAGPAALAGASTAMLASPVPTSTGGGGTTMRLGGGSSGGPTVTRLAPKQTPVAVYLDGVEIAHRIEARRALAATTSVRRSA
jgi:tape measure domain-containing protein